MERKLRLDLIGKEIVKRWYILIALLVLCVAAGCAYAYVKDDPSYTATASISVQAVSNEPNPQINLIESEKSNIYTKLVDNELRSKLNAKVVEVSAGAYNSDTDMSKIYTMSQENNSLYRIVVKMPTRDGALAVAKVFTENMLAEDMSTVTSSKVAATLSLNEAAYISDSSSAIAMWLAAVLGFVGGIILYIVVCFCIFYFNGKMYDAEEFKENFAVAVLTDGRDSGSATNVAIKTLLGRRSNELFVIATNRATDVDKLAGGFAALNLKVVLGDVKTVSLGDAAVVSDGVFSVLGGDGAVKSLAVATNEIKTKLDGKFDVLLVVSDFSAERKDLLLMADCADATVVTVDLKTESYKKIRQTFEELGEVKNINLAGAIL